MKVFIRRPTIDDSRNLSEILCHDDILRNELRIKNNNYPTPEAFLQKVSDWEKKYNSETFAIVAGKQSVGTISLTHINTINRKARMGCWVGSKFRRKGYCTKGVEELLTIAHIKGIKTISSKIENDNPASYTILKKLGAKEMACCSAKTEYTLQL